MRDWVNWLGKVEKNGAKVVLVECSPAIVAQINLVNNFTGQRRGQELLRPVLLPQLRSGKGAARRDARRRAAAPFKAPTCRCDECDGPMDFDDMEESYFAFLSNAKKIVTDSRVDSVINEFTPTDGDRKIRSRTGGTNPGGAARAPSRESAACIRARCRRFRRCRASVRRRARGPGSGTGSISGVNGFGSGVSGVRSTAAALAELEARRSQTNPTALAPGKSNAAWIVVVALIIVAVGLLGFVMFGGKH